jgi:hypothetical protein
MRSYAGILFFALYNVHLIQTAGNLHNDFRAAGKYNRSGLNHVYHRLSGGCFRPALYSLYAYPSQEARWKFYLEFEPGYPHGGSPD